MAKPVAAPVFKFCPQCGGPLKLNSENFQLCPDDGWIHYPRTALASAGIVINSKGEVLLVQRNREPFKGDWMFPAGFLGYGEDPGKAAVREVREETGYRVGNPKLLDVLSVHDDPRVPALLLLSYELILLSPRQLRILDPEENMAVSWFDPRKHPKIGFESHRIILSHLAGRG